MAVSDTRSASLIMVAGAVGVGWWWFHIKRGVLASSPTPGTGDTGMPNNKVDLQVGAPGPNNPLLGRLKAFAAQHGLTVTSGYRPGANSLHGEGRAIDVETPAADVQAEVKAAAEALGIHVYPEVKGQVAANGSVSTGNHWHLSFPEMRNGHLVF